jgi:cytochrome P450
VHETLRTHPPVVETNRVAKLEDVIPLSSPITTQNGETIDSIVIPKGTRVTAPISMVNRIEAFWGPDSMEFKPERWLDSSGDSLKKNEIQGHKHILTFSDGPRICLGKAFALAEFKSVLSVLIRNFEFSFVDGVEPKLVKHTGILPRPKPEGEEKACMPLLVRRVEQ